MATGDVVYGYGAFAPGETVNLYAKDVSPGGANISLAKSGVAAATGGVTIAGVARTMTQHGVTVRAEVVGVGATSARQIGAVPAP